MDILPKWKQKLLECKPECFSEFSDEEYLDIVNNELIGNSWGGSLPGIKKTEEHKQNISKAHKGKSIPKKQRKRISDTLKRRYAAGEIKAVTNGHFTKNTKWWTDGEKNKRRVKCPGEGWVLGRTCNFNPDFSSGMKWWTNGKIEKFCKECPSADFKRGRMKW